MPECLKIQIQRDQYPAFFLYSRGDGLVGSARQSLIPNGFAGKPSLSQN
jgi:hypothetical protein